jgi:hypothetical protein
LSWQLLSPLRQQFFGTAIFVRFARESWNDMSGANYVSGVNDGRSERWTLTFERLFQEQDPQGTPAARLDGQLVDARVLTEPEALGFLLRGQHICAKP